MVTPNPLSGAKPGQAVRLLAPFLAWRESGRGSEFSRNRGGPGLRFLTPSDGLRFLQLTPDREGCCIVADQTGAAWRCPIGFLTSEPAPA